MKVINFKLLLTCFLMICAYGGFSQPSLTAKDILNNTMLYDFGRFAVDIIISSDSALYWKDVKTGQDAHEKTKRK